MIVRYDNIQKLREQIGKTPSEIAKMLSCPLEMYVKYENGECDPPGKIMVALSKIYHTSVDYLLGLTSNQQPH